MTSSVGRVGYLSSMSLAAVGIVYALVVAFGIWTVGLDAPIEDPTLAVMEGLTLGSSVVIVILMSSICVHASHERKVFAIIALAFSVVMAGLTSAVHFVTLTAGRQTGFTVLEWPSSLYAVELLAWDLFLGLSLLFAAFVFPGPGIRAAVRWALLTAGSLSLLGIVGPLLGDMALQRIGILGYGIVLPVACVLLARYFRHDPAY